MFRERKKLPKFIIAKSSKATQYGLSKLKYRKNIEFCTVASLLVIIALFRLTTSLDIEKYLSEDNSKFKFFQLTEIPPPIEPPEQLKMEKVVEIKERKEPEANEEINEIIEEIEEMLGENETEEQLVLASNSLDNYLLTNSQLTGISGPQLNLRESLASNTGDLKFGRGSQLTDASSGGLDIGASTTQRRGVEIAKTDLDLNIGESTKRDESQKKKEETEAKLNIEGKPVKVLSFASASIGTEDYKLWNKIISELDRLNKGRSGTASDQLQRTRGGFQLSFSYNDMTKQEIHWRNDGNIWIQIIGNSSKTNLQELQRALGAMLRLSL